MDVCMCKCICVCYRFVLPAILLLLMLMLLMLLVYVYRLQSCVLIKFITIFNCIWGAWQKIARRKKHKTKQLARKIYKNFSYFLF